jgi:hypothetical protein
LAGKVKGYPGVSIETVRYKRRRGKLKGRQKTYVYYKARISIGGRVVQLGHFSTPKAAAETYQRAKLKLS